MLKNLRHRAAPPAPTKAEAGLATPVPQTRFADRLTIIVPSVAGRLRFFDTALRHFATCGVRWPIVVSDHSTTEHEGVLDGAAARYPGLDLRVLRHPPGMHFLERLARCAEATRTDYAMLHADDDFMMPAAVESSLEFLDSHPDFAACQGRMAAFRIPAPGQVHIDKIDGRMRTEDDAGDRILRQLANFTPTLYAIHRREVFMECCLRTLEYTTNVTFWQYLASCIALLRGKLGTVDELHYVRLNNELGWRSQLIGQRDPSHWPYLAVSGDFSAELARFRSALLALLGTGAETELSRRIDDACIWLIRRGLCGMTEAPPEPGEEAFLTRLRTPGSGEYRLLEYCVRCVGAAAGSAEHGSAGGR